MLRVTALAIAAVCGVVMAGSAKAADMPSSWDLPSGFKGPYTDLVSGWYFRTDLGLTRYTVNSVDVPPPELVTAHNIRDTYSVGLGGGYKWQWFRTDVTLDYVAQSLFKGDTASTLAYYSVKVDSFVLLANVYLDLGTWGGFTPYIGAGVGMAHLRTHDYITPALTTGDDVQPSTRTNLAWAAMAGMTYQLSRTVLLDVGYRYLSLGDAITGPEPLAYTTPIYLRDMTAQEIRIGLRWLLD